MNEVSDVLLLPAGFAGWNPLLQASTLAALTFVTEDGVAIGASLLSAIGVLSWPTAFMGVFLGIWMGDVALYSMARWWGRGLLKRRWFQRFLPASRLASSERWFAKHGAWALLTSRILPGTRLPTYLAAGFLRMPLTRFVVVTGIAVLAWCAAVFIVGWMLGPAVHGVLAKARNAALVFPLILVSVWLLLAALQKLADQRARWRLLGFVGRWRRWEFWPAWLFYAPVALYYVWLSLRFRGCTLPTAANPGMTHGGMVGESKFDTLRELMATHPEFTATALKLDPAEVATRSAQVAEWMTAHGFAFPVVLKPDLGQRGVGVRVVRSELEVSAYLGEVAAPVVAQRYVTGPCEAGVFYVRRPGESRGRILAITEKVFPHLIGDGIHTIEDLIWRDKRARCVARRYLQRLKERAKDVLPKGEALRLVETGNHAQGCIFRNGAEWWSPELERKIDEISRSLTGFHFGRYDLRFTSLEELRAGRGFQILELNGAASEVTGIYDARNSLASAYRTLFRQWRTVYEIGAANRANGSAPTSLPRLYEAWRAAARHFAACPAGD